MTDLEAADFENPNPSIHDLFTYYNQIYFEDKLGPCTLQWSSKRMTFNQCPGNNENMMGLVLQIELFRKFRKEGALLTYCYRCAGVCQYSTYGGCEIRLSEPLLKYRPISDLKNTLLHEMIHAYLFLTNGNKDHDDHGPCFQNMMMMINDFNLVDEERPPDGYAIKIYHSFTDEVDLYRTHHWRCVNCSDLIKRAMNRTPSASDCLIRSDACSNPRCHWHIHQRRCGGSYEKIHEPAAYVDKRKKAAPLAFVDHGNVNGQSGDRDDSHLTVNGQKRKMGSNGGISKKRNKESPVQVKSASLDKYFCPIEKDEEKILYTQTTAVEKGNSIETPFEVEDLSPGELNKGRKYFMLNDTSQKESGSDQMDEGKRMNLRSRSFSTTKEVEERLLPKVAPTELEECSCKAADYDRRKTLGTLSKASTNNGAGEETLGTCGDSPSRKKYKTVNELLKKHTRKEPLVILAWANWVTYESDEENEEPLINRRTKRRKQEWNSDVLKKGKTILDTSEDLEPVAVEESRNVSGIPKEIYCKHPLEQVVQKVHNSQVAHHDDGEKETPPKVIVTDNEQIFIELSDDDKFPEATGEINNSSKGQTLNDRCVFSKQTISDLRDFDKQDPSESSLKRAKQTATSKTLEGEMLSTSQRNRSNGREESNTATDMMICPICNERFREHERNTIVNKHIDDCLARAH